MIVISSAFTAAIPYSRPAGDLPVLDGHGTSNTVQEPIIIHQVNVWDVCAGPRFLLHWVLKTLRAMVAIFGWTGR